MALRRIPALRRLAGDPSGQSMLETIIVLPVLMLLTLLIMEASLIFNAKQMANYAAFCAARTASVYGYQSDDEQKEKELQRKIRMAAAMPMSCVSPKLSGDLQGQVNALLGAFGLSHVQLSQSLQGVLPGGELLGLLDRFADAYLRTSIDFENDVRVGQGPERENITVTVTYIYNCTVLPLGVFWPTRGPSSLLGVFQNPNRGYPGSIWNLVTVITGRPQRNFVLRGTAKMDYWAN